MKIRATQRLASARLHPEVQKVTKDTLAKLKRQYPKIGRRFKGIEFRRQNKSNYDPWDEKIYTWLFERDKDLAYNDRVENQETSALQYGYEGMLVHEYAHHIDHALRKMLKEEDKEDFQLAKRDLEKKVGYPSSYARTNSREWFAEQFLQEYMRGGQGPLTALINQFYERV